MLRMEDPKFKASFGYKVTLKQTSATWDPVSKRIKQTKSQLYKQIVRVKETKELRETPKPESNIK